MGMFIYTVSIIGVLFISNLVHSHPRKGCSKLDINSKISILNETTDFFNGIIIPDAYIKRIFDVGWLYFELKALVGNSKHWGEHDNDFRVFCPSAVWIAEMNLYLVSVRVYQGYWRNFVYVSYFDKDWNRSDYTKNIGKTTIPGFLPIDGDWEMEYSGPEDMRLFRALNGKFFGSFNMIDQTKRRYMMLYDFEKAECRKLTIDTMNDSAVVFEKNWMPLIVNEEHIYFIYNFKTLQIIDCTDQDQGCTIKAGKLDRNPAALRGGSSFLRFKDSDYFFSFGFTHLDAFWPKHSKQYRPCLVLVKYSPSEPHFQLIYTSEPIDFNNRVFIEPVYWYKNVESIDYFDKWGTVMFITSIGIVDYYLDVSDVTITINDEAQIILKINGLTKFIQRTIDLFESDQLPVDDNCAEKYAFSFYKFSVNLPEKTKPEKELIDRFEIKEDEWKRLSERRTKYEFKNNL